jgi:hypothetical protein
MGEQQRLYGAAAVAAGAGRRFNLKGESVIESWGEIIERGAGHAKEVMQKTERLIIDANMPNVSTTIHEVSTAFFGQKRDFLIVTNDSIRDYKLFINARDYGTLLDVSWFLTLEPRAIKRALSKAMTGNPHAFSQQVDIFVQQDIRAFVGTAVGIFRHVLDELFEELKLDSSILNKKSRGYLDIW